MKVPKKVIDRLSATLKQFQAVAFNHKTNDVSEADTVTLIKDILADSFGFDKYSELTSEQQIRGTYCDLAVKIGGKIKYLIEVKAAGVTLTDSHLRQALNYAANQGIEWVVLTNAVEWQLHRLKFGQPIDHELVSSFNLLDVSTKKPDDLEHLFLLCREGIGTDAMDSFHQHVQILNKYTLAQLLLTEPLLSALRRELRRLYPDVKADTVQLADILNNEVLKREVIEGDKAKETQQKLKRVAAKLSRTNEKNDSKSTKTESSKPQQTATAFSHSEPPVVADTSIVTGSES